LTYIRLKEGFIYLTVILDWHTRYVIGWRLSDTLEGSFERFWRTVKYEDIYLREYRTLAEARTGLARYIDY
jgi:putative transposase